MRSYACVLAVLLSGCVAMGPTYEEAADSRLIAFNYAAADALVEQSRPLLDPARPILAATLVSIDDLERSSRLGRLVSEHVGSRLAQQGLPVVEMKMRGTIFMRRSEGELLLSRDVTEIADSHQAQAVVVGTYAPAGHYVYVTVKLVRSIDNVVLAAHNYTLPLDSNIGAMLPE